MKKFYTMVLTLALSVALSGICFAANSEGDTYGNIVANLEKDSYGGAYLKDGVLHIKPMSEQNQVNIMTMAENEDAVVIIDEPAKYTMEELNKAMEDSIVLFEELDIDFVAIDEENNGLAVGMFGVTEAKMDRFREEINIDAILFQELGVVEDVVSKIEVENKSVDNTKSARAVGEVPSGVRITDISQKNDDDKYLEATNGASVYNSAGDYFVTTAHGTKGDDQFRYVTLMGQVEHHALNPDAGVDIALIRKAPTASLSLQAFDANLMLSSGAPITGASAKVLNGVGSVPVTITYASCTKSWNDRKNGDVGTYKNIMMMKPTGTAITQSGYSGSAIVTEYTNSGATYYKICGIYKGAGEDAGTQTKIARNYLYATRWDVLEDYFNVNLH